MQGGTADPGQRIQGTSSALFVGTMSLRAGERHYTIQGARSPQEQLTLPWSRGHSFRAVLASFLYMFEMVRKEEGGAGVEGAGHDSVSSQDTQKRPGRETSCLERGRRLLPPHFLLHSNHVQQTPREGTALPETTQLVGQPGTSSCLLCVLLSPHSGLLRPPQGLWAAAGPMGPTADRDQARPSICLDLHTLLGKSVPLSRPPSPIWSKVQAQSL